MCKHGLPTDGTRDGIVQEWVIHTNTKCLDDRHEAKEMSIYSSRVFIVATCSRLVRYCRLLC